MFSETIIYINLIYQSAYLPSDVKSWKIFTLMYIGLNLPLILLQCLGAILQVGTMAIPSWSDSYDSLGLGGQLDAILMPLHGFRKFVLVSYSIKLFFYFILSI